MKKHAIIPIFVPHIGCSESCVFCDQKQITARSKAPSPEEVRTTIETWLTTLENTTYSQNNTSSDNSNTVKSFSHVGDIDNFHNTTSSDNLNTVKSFSQVRDSDDSTIIEIAFYGGSFTAIPMSMQERYLAVAKDYVDSGRVKGLHLSTRPDCITPEILDMLRNYGVKTIELGVQSFDDKILEKSKRGHNSETVKNACRMIKEFGVSNSGQPFFDLGIQLMVGLPGDSLESCIYSAKEAVKLKPKLARIYPTLVLEGTELMEMYESGEYSPLSREDAILWSKTVYEILDDAGIYIMRVGLKSTDIINSQNLGEINAGPYHPAFRQLVEGEIARDRICKLLDELADDKLSHGAPSEVSSQIAADSHGTEGIELTYNSSQIAEDPHKTQVALTVYCAPSWISNAAGHKGVNREFFRKEYPQFSISFSPDKTLIPGKFRIE